MESKLFLLVTLVIIFSEVFFFFTFSTRFFNFLQLKSYPAAYTLVINTHRSVLKSEATLNISNIVT